MQFTTLAISALSIGSALAADQIKVHVVKVGGANGTLIYSPNNLVAAAGDMVQFQFAPANHTVTQSTFDNPCQPIALHSNVTGVYSGYMPVQASAQMTPTYTIMINDSKPMWLYCSQGKHCQNGMTMVINENTNANATRSLANYQASAKTQTQNLPGDSVSNGTSGTTSNSGGDGSSGSSSTSSGGPSQATGASAASALQVSGSLAVGGILAVAMALFV